MTTRISAAEASKLLAKPKKRSKYRNVPVKDPVDGHFHSTSEHNRWKELKLLERAGEIYQLSRQVSFPLTVEGILICTYVADYVYRISAIEIDKHGRILNPLRVEDRKGGKAKTEAKQLFDIKRRLMKACYAIDIKVTGKGT